MDEIKVYILQRKGRRNYVMRYLNPDDGRWVERSAGTRIRRDAERAAGTWEAELRSGQFKQPSKATFDEFVDEYCLHHLGGKKASTQQSYLSSFNVFVRKMNVKCVADIDSKKLAAFATRLRESGSRPATIARHLRHLKAALNWAAKYGYLTQPVQVDIDNSQTDMRGRPITAEEFERMLTAVPKIVGEQAADSYRFFLRGLWESGLRIGEAVQLRWDGQQPGAMVVDMDGRRPMLRIPASAEKGGKWDSNPHDLAATGF